MDAEFLRIAKMNEDEARAELESIRWANGIVCPKCGSSKGAYKLTSKPGSVNQVKPGTYKCKDCRKKFTVTMGTIFEDSHIPLNKWLLAIYLMNSSKKGISSHQIHRTLEVTYKTAWFMTHRIRHAMKGGILFERLTGIIEADETYVGGLEKNKHKNKRTEGNQGRSLKTKTPVAVLVQRNGMAKARKVNRTDSATLQENIKKHVAASATIITDEYGAYNGLAENFAGHEVINHSEGEYARGDVTTNTAESYAALLKRGIVGTFHHVSETHLERYVTEFNFRWNYRKLKDSERNKKALQATEGKRLMYKNTIKKDPLA